MHATQIAVVVEGLVLAAAVLFIVALLRSHADILRKLDALEADDPGSGPPFGHASELGDGAASGISGQTLAGDAVTIALGPGSGRTLLAFLSSTCNACGEFWRTAEDGYGLEVGSRLMVITKGPERERLARLQELAPEHLEVVMSTDAWDAYAIPATPHFVLVADGQVIGRGSALSWDQVRGMIADADADSRVYRDRARSTSERARRAEQALAAAGITAGDPSLTPSRQEPGQGTMP